MARGRAAAPPPPRWLAVARPVWRDDQPAARDGGVSGHDFDAPALGLRQEIERLLRRHNLHRLARPDYIAGLPHVHGALTRRRRNAAYHRRREQEGPPERGRRTGILACRLRTADWFWGPRFRPLLGSPREKLRPKRYFRRNRSEERRVGKE